MAALWLTDYDPFFTKFMDNSSRLELYDYYDKKTSLYKYSIEKEVASYGEFKHGSLYIWGEAREFFYEVFKEIVAQLRIQLDNAEALKDKKELQSKIWGIAITAIGTVAGKFFKAYEKIIRFATTVLKFIVCSIIESGIPDDEIATYHVLIPNFEKIMVAIYPNGSYKDDDKVAKLDIVYKITEDGNNVIYDFKNQEIEDYFYGDDIISSCQPNSPFKGTIYPIYEGEDFENAVYHIKSDEREDVITCDIKEYVLGKPNGYSLNEGEYNWYSFVAPEKGTYDFYSTCIRHEKDNLDVVGELFSELVPGRSIENRIAFDDNSGGDGNFNFHYNLEKNQKVYIRVRGASWKTHGQNYTLVIRKIPGKFFEIGENQNYFETVDLAEPFNIYPIRYTFNFKSGGYKIFQTFGEEDTHLKLFDDCNIEVANNDDEGYENNALINYEVEKIIRELKHTKLNIIEKNYTRFIQFGVMENHKTERTEEIIGLFEKISRIATGSFGLLYFLNDEDKIYNDEFRVLVSKKGVTEWKKDDYFSPCCKMIEDFE